MSTARIRKDVVEDYRELFAHDESGEARARGYQDMVRRYYDLVTDFYEFGWGRSFHFAPVAPGESFRASIARHERRLSEALRLKSGLKVLDLGCGVGGPMIEIARHSGAHVVGVNLNAYQVERARGHVRRARLDSRCEIALADFMSLPVSDASFDAAYAIEATCHAPDRTKLFTEVHRVLAPGGELAAYEWCVTARYRASDPEHRAVIAAIEEGDGLPPLTTTHAVDAALSAAGFDLLVGADLAGEGAPEAPWFAALGATKLTLKNLPRHRLGRRLTGQATRLLERLGVAPEGTTEVSQLLQRAADALVRGGELGIFTPMYFVHARKPAR
jgi:cyclopropane fatty-acyl-phospholipid synthase-like methyltransferase